MGKASQRQFLVKVEGIDGYFATKSGGEESADTSKVYDGGSLVPEVMAAPSEWDNVTVGRPFDPERDRPVIKSLRGRTGRERRTVSVTDTDPDLVPIGEPTVFPKALLTRIADPDSDASSGDAATFELEFAVEQAT